jgi:hypothetical protein
MLPGSKFQSWACAARPFYLFSKAHDRVKLTKKKTRGQKKKNELQCDNQTINNNLPPKCQELANATRSASETPSKPFGMRNRFTRSPQKIADCQVHVARV